MHITGGYLRSRKLISPKGENVRPTLSKTRESVFNVLSNLIDFEDADFLDVFAGSGIMGIEALSRGFEFCTFIERDRKTCLLLKENLKNLNITEESANVCFGDALKVLKKTEKNYSLIYIDPPYQKGLYNDIVKTIFKKKLLKPDGIMVLEHLNSEQIDTQEFSLIKQKNYSDKTVSFLQFNSQTL